MTVLSRIIVWNADGTWLSLRTVSYLCTRWHTVRARGKACFLLVLQGFPCGAACPRWGGCSSGNASTGCRLARDACLFSGFTRVPGQPRSDPGAVLFWPGRKPEIHEFHWFYKGLPSTVFCLPTSQTHMWSRAVRARGEACLPLVLQGFPCGVGCSRWGSTGCRSFWPGRIYEKCLFS